MANIKLWWASGVHHGQSTFASIIASEPPVAREIISTPAYSADVPNGAVFALVEADIPIRYEVMAKDSTSLADANSIPLPAGLSGQLSGVIGVFPGQKIHFVDA